MKQLRRVLAVICSLCIVLSVLTFGAVALNKSGTCGSGITWTFDSATGVLNIEGSGMITSAPFNNEAYAITKIILSDGITGFVANAFDELPTAKFIRIPASATSLGANAFYYDVGFAPTTGEDGDDGAANATKSYSITICGKGGSAANTYATSNGIPFVLDNNPTVPEAPTVATLDDGVSVTLTVVEGVEYSIDGVNFQASNIFTGLKPKTEYNFYQRYAANDQYDVSGPSEPLVYKTGRMTPEAPEAPIAIKVTSTTVTLKYVDGYEYSRGGTSYQASAEFKSLTPGTEYKFYCRMYATDTTTASPRSPVLKVTTLSDEGNVSIAKPNVIGVTQSTITLYGLDGFEYSINGGTTWQRMTIFSGLQAGHEYTFCQRIAATDGSPASVPSESVTVRTSPVTGIADLNDDGQINAADLTRFRKILVGDVTLGNIAIADFNYDGVVNVIDFVRLKRYLAGAVDRIDG